MNVKTINLIKNFSYTILSNLVSLIVSSLVIIVVPKLIGIREYGYWQLYMFYSSYVGFMHFGWNDGIYLRYGGKRYNELDKELFFSQFWMLFIFQMIIAIIAYFAINILIKDTNKNFILLMTIVCMISVNLRRMILYILQATNKIKQYAHITITDKTIYVIILVISLSLGLREYKYMIIIDLVGKIISLIYGMICCRDIVFKNVTMFKYDFIEAYKNINVGIKLMIANIASILIIGTVRFGIEHSWDVSTFGKVSLILSICNLVMVFINAIGVVMFPILRRTNVNKLPKIYSITRDLLMVILLFILLLNYPIKIILSTWLPNYAQSLEYITLVFPLIIFEAKMVLLINTYLKTLRKEKIILKINVLTLILSIGVTLLTSVVIHKLNYAILSIVVLLGFRTIVSELILSKILKICLYKDIILEVILVTIFIITGRKFNILISVITYLISYVSYLIIKKDRLNNMIYKLKMIIQS